MHRAGRYRPGRCAEAAAVDRLDPHRARPGRSGAPLYQMGRPAGLGRSGARVAVARRLAGDHGAMRAGLCQPRRRHAGGAAARTAAADRRRALRSGGGACAARSGAADPGRNAAAQRTTAGDPVRPGLAPRRPLGEPRGAGRGAGRARADRPEAGRGVSHRSSVACRCAGDIPGPRRDAGAGGGGCRAEPRLGRSRRHAAQRGLRGRRSSTYRSTTRCITAGAWTTRACRRPTCSWRPMPMRRWRHCWRSCRPAAERRPAKPWPEMIVRTRPDQRAADGADVAPGARRAARVAAACVAVLERRGVAVPRSRSTISAATAARASAAVRGLPSARRWRCAARGGCRSRCAATATS